MTQSLTRSARFSTGMSLRPCSYFIQHMALIFSRVTPPSFHQSSFLPEACAARASGDCGARAARAAGVEPVTSEVGIGAGAAGQREAEEKRRSAASKLLGHRYAPLIRRRAARFASARMKVKLSTPRRDGASCAAFRTRLPIVRARLSGMGIAGPGCFEAPGAPASGPMGPGSRPRGKTRGDGAPRGALGQPTPCGARARGARARRLSALHRGDFGPRDRASGVRRRALARLIRQAFAPFVRPASSPSNGRPT